MRLKFIIFFYLIITTAFFIYFVRNTPGLIWDQIGYYEYATILIDNHFNILTTDFGDRTFVYPAFLAIIKFISSTGHNIQPVWASKDLLPFYLVNLLLFHTSNFLVFKSLNKLSQSFANIFLLISSFNIVNLGLTNMLLSENLCLFFVSLIFFLLINFKQSFRWFFFLGLTGALLVYTRPASLILFFGITIYLIIRQMALKNISKLLPFFLGSLMVFSIGITNAYFINYRIQLFSEKTKGLALAEYAYGINFYKFDSCIDKICALPDGSYTPQMLYTNKDNFKLDKNCTSPLGCQFHLIKQNPKAYLTMIFAHLFAVFDRTYLLEVYIKDISAINNYLRFSNYFLLSGVLIYLLFFKKDSKLKLFVNIATIISLLYIISYLPVFVDSRYSAPIYPILFALFTLYIIKLLKQPFLIKIKFLSLQLIFILISFYISNQILNTLHIGRWGY